MLAESLLILGFRYLQAQASPFTDEGREDQRGKEGPVLGGTQVSYLPLPDSALRHICSSPLPLSAPSPTAASPPHKPACSELPWAAHWSRGRKRWSRSCEVGPRKPQKQGLERFWQHRPTYKGSNRERPSCLLLLEGLDLL